MKGFSSGLFLNEKKILEAGEQNIASLRIKTPSIDEIVGQLSGGNQQKVVIGKWVNTDAEIFYLLTNRPVVSTSAQRSRFTT